MTLTAPELHSRREQNKLATRQAIIQAALLLLRNHGLGQFTADQLAEEAGISRRTFFNYFPSPEAALAATTEGFLDVAIASFYDRPADESLLDSAIAAVSALADPGHLGPMAEVCSLTIGQAQMSRFQLEAWDNATARLTEATLQRLGPDTDQLYVRAMVGAVIACGKAAMEIWLERHGGKDNTPESLAELRQLLVESISLLRDGFAH
ncbi:TetR family transcriptional regulator [Pseudarthrobacter sp. J1738]|uniref:TetR family transcriptional regulator n=1 Tax=unclassified Pseudarthrobacter TaxID=2647000 RepID=UPI003D2BE711